MGPPDRQLSSFDGPSTGTQRANSAAQARLARDVDPAAVGLGDGEGGRQAEADSRPVSGAVGTADEEAFEQAGLILEVESPAPAVCDRPSDLGAVRADRDGDARAVG